jgi:hypothetical protein
MWQMQLEEHAVFSTKHADGVGQNFRLRAIIPVEEGKFFKVPQLFRLVTFINSAPGGSTGLGDTTVEQFFILDKSDWGEFGLGSLGSKCRCFLYSFLNNIIKYTIKY